MLIIKYSSAAIDLPKRTPYNLFLKVLCLRHEDTKGQGMAEYYRYLWIRTWPAVTSLVLLWIFVVLRFGWKTRYTWRFERDAWGFLVLFSKGLVWAAVLAAGTFMFVRNEADWFAKPASYEGVIRSKEAENGHYLFRLDEGKSNMHPGGGSEELAIDPVSYQLITVGEHVKVIYLPVRKETVSLQVLAPSGTRNVTK